MHLFLVDVGSGEEYSVSSSTSGRTTFIFQSNFHQDQVINIGGVPNGDYAIKVRKSDTIKYVASFPGLPCFYLLFAFTVIHGSGRPVKIFVDLPIPCIIVNANRRSKRGRPGTEANKYVLLIHE